jgi:GTP diphosphokinase / guanosine-3',5'-bis(diphosphate) 3'-diphosphatase
MIEASAILKGNGPVIEPEIQHRLDDLLQACKLNLPDYDEEIIIKAFRLSHWAHRNDRRETGEPYIVHPLAVATIFVQQIGFDDLGVVAALLHDVVEDTDVTLEFIRESFGTDLALIIDGLTKISGAFASRDVSQAENVRKLILSMASDVRVILVKFADRLHNMQTLESLEKRKQIKIASETLDLFAPLARRFGYNAVKNELEDLSLKILNPEAYDQIVAGLRDAKPERDAYVQRFIDPIRERLAGDGFEFEIYGRSKNLYSIYRKMQRQDKPLEEIYDIIAIRIILKDTDQKGKEDCWRVYSIMTDKYKPLPERFRDFISVPKSNGYQSLHTTVLGPEGRRVEVQIRTEEMHQIAEKGVAAHWKYKEGVSRSDAEMDHFLAWVRDLLESPNPEHATEFVQDFRLNLYDEEIYVFTPRGHLFSLPKDATPIDFAFLVHTEVGFHCIGSKVNGKMVPLSHKLKSGDQVEIITSKKQTPNPDWVKFVVTQKARSRIRHWIKEKRRKTVEYGRQTWIKRARKAGIELSNQELSRYANRFKFSNTQQLFFEIGSGLFNVSDLVKSVLGDRHTEGEKEKEADSVRLQFDSFLDTAQSSGKPALLIDGELHTDIVTQYAPCCNPIPGDKVFGFISRTGGIKIHRVSCRNSPHLIMNQAERVVSVEWSRQKDIQFIAALRVMGEDRVGLISDVTTVISKSLKTNIRSISVSSEDGVFVGNIVLFVSDLEHLKRLIQRIKRISGVHGVYRFEEGLTDA